MNKLQQRQLERSTVSKDLKCFVRGSKLVINGLSAPNLNKDNYIEVTLGEVKGTFIVLCKELISQTAQLEEIGSCPFGNSENELVKCDFSNITYVKIVDEKEIAGIKRMSRLL